MNIKKIDEAIRFLEDIAKDADDLIYDLQEIEIIMSKLDQKIRLVKESAKHARDLIEWEINKTTQKQGEDDANTNNVR